VTATFPRERLVPHFTKRLRGNARGRPNSSQPPCAELSDGVEPGSAARYLAGHQARGGQGVDRARAPLGCARAPRAPSRARSARGACATSPAYRGRCATGPIPGRAPGGVRVPQAPPIGAGAPRTPFPGALRAACACHKPHLPDSGCRVRQAAGVLPRASSLLPLTGADHRGRFGLRGRSGVLPRTRTTAEPGSTAVTGEPLRPAWRPRCLVTAVTSGAGAPRPGRSQAHPGFDSQPARRPDVSRVGMFRPTGLGVP